MKQIYQISFVILCLLGVGCGNVRSGYQPKPGDIIFQSFPHGPLTDAIETVSDSPYSHCGLIVRTAAGFGVLEAIGPVTTTPLDDWIKRGRNRDFAAYRLKAAYTGQLDAIISAAQSFSGRPYDTHFQFDDAEIYCSELIFKAFQRVTGGNLGAVRKLGAMHWKPAEAFIRKIEGGVCRWTGK